MPTFRLNFTRSLLKNEISDSDISDTGVFQRGNRHRANAFQHEIYCAEFTKKGDVHVYSFTKRGTQSFNFKSPFGWVNG